MGLVDGDQRTRVDASQRVHALPGEQYPQAHVFDRVLERIDSVAARLTVSMQLPTSMQERVKAVVRSRALTNRDRDVVFQQWIRCSRPPVG